MFSTRGLPSRTALPSFLRLPDVLATNTVRTTTSLPRRSVTDHLLANSRSRFNAHQRTASHFAFRDHFNSNPLLGCKKDSGLIMNRLQRRVVSMWPSGRKSDWQKALSDAEKVVGYPTSFMSLRYLLSDELSNVAMHLRKLVGTKHPILKTARGFVYDGNNSMQTRGLLVLLVSKAAGPGGEWEEEEEEEGEGEDSNGRTMVSGIYRSQRSLAEITEMIHTAYLMHRGVVNLEEVTSADGTVGDMSFGNKMAVLSGDFLLANACTGLAQLRNTKVVEIVSSAIADMMEGSFLLEQDNQGVTFLPDKDWTIKDWTNHSFLCSGSLIAKSCQAAMMLAGHRLDIQKKAYNYGKHMALAHRLHADLLPFSDSSDPNMPFALTSAPMVLHMEHAGRAAVTDKITQVSDKAMKVDYKQLRLEVLKGPAVHAAKELCYDHSQKALAAVTVFQESEAKSALENMTRAVTRF
ncbi:decaprenyl-diphosphate synthase subunit 2-like [Branchiostoma floridae]|uniref:Decaprenyl-diphosphate synthase subunit 2-like n=2 Tax=Branchiostoma floridae TaxID=7739 RepID=A0A9J7LRY7_BRAFL|nr:decaprenyl-diphosphate synthase subunit 2-like [Branchiostoma floridae]